MTADDLTRDTTTRRRDQPGGTIDFSMMYFAHDAFTRDLRRMATAVELGRTGDQAVRNGWETFKKQLHVHHMAEDEAIWPQMREKITSPEEIAILDLMEAEHGRIDPLLARIDAELETGGPGLAAAVDEAATALIAHMEHEEERALPLAEKTIGAAGWNKYVKYLQKTQGIGGVAEFIPWALDGVSDSTRKRLLGQLPAPARPVITWVFEPRYARTPRWNLSGNVTAEG